MNRTGVVAAFSEAQIYAALVLAYPEQVRVIERKDNLLFSLPNDVLIYVLSFAWPCAAVLARCSKRMCAIVQLRAFWEPAVRAHMRKMLAKKPAGLTAADVLFYSNRWTPFDDWLLPELKHQVGWLFPIANGASNSKIRWCDYTDDTMGLKLEYRNVFKVHWARANNANTYHGFFVHLLLKYQRDTYYWAPDQRHGIICAETHDAEVQTVRFYDIVFSVNNIGIRCRWQGQGIVSKTIPTKILTAHGNGKWTNYDTGEVILEGDNVAFAGKIHDGITWFAGKPASGQAKKKYRKLV